MSKPPKIDRKSLKKPDEFVVTGRTLMDRLAEHRNVLLGVIGAFVALSALYYSYRWWSTSRLNASWEKYVTVLAENEDTRWKALESFFDDAPNLRPRYLAAIGLADHHFELEKKRRLEAGAAPAGEAAKSESEAVKWYERALEFGGLLPVEKQLVLINLGQALEMAGELDRARERYQEASGIEAEAKGYALLNVGRTWELAGEVTKAKEHYDSVAKEFPGTEFGKQAKNYARALQSPLMKDILGR